MHPEVPANFRLFLISNFVVPFQSTYRPIWVGMGALTLDLLIAVMATSLLRRHISRRAWRGLNPARAAASWAAARWLTSNGEESTPTAW